MNQLSDFSLRESYLAAYKAGQAILSLNHSTLNKKEFVFFENQILTAQYAPASTREFFTQQELDATLQVLLAGNPATKKLGLHQCTLFEEDYITAKNLAYKMVRDYGMSSNLDIYLCTNPSCITTEVDKLLGNALQKSTAIIDESIQLEELYHALLKNPYLTFKMFIHEL